MIGREAELSTLEDALLSALRGDGGVVIVGGEAGMGKTRLVNAVAATARRLGVVVIAGGNSEAELSLPYLPFLEAIGNYLAGAQPAALRERLGPAADELAQLFPQLGRAAASTGDAASAKMRLFESILMLLGDAASNRALLLILEDLQWADPATRELLDYSTRRLRSTNVLIVATYRTDEMHRKHALLPTIQGWRRSGQVEMVDLHPLTAHLVGDMVCAIFEETSISDEFRDFLHERSEGNPFVLEEMLRDALDRGEIFRTETGWDRKTLSEFRIPPTVRDTILQRLERLSPEHVAVLAAASVMGRSFEIASLAEVARVDETVALAALEATVTAQLTELEDRITGRYRFRHALTREAVYEDLVVPRRQQLHSRVADVLMARGAGASVDVANHLFMAARSDEAVTMCVAASDEAIRSLAFRDAGELLERAAPYLKDTVERGRLMCRAADCYWNNSESAHAKRLLEQGIPDLERAGLSVEGAHNRLLLGRCWWELLRSDLAREEYERSRSVLEAEGPSEDLAVAYMRLGGLLSWDSKFDEAMVSLTKAVAIAEEAGADLARAWSLIFLGGVEADLGEVARGFAHAEEGYNASVAGSYRFQAFNAAYNATWGALRLGLGDLLWKWFDRAEAVLARSMDAWPPFVRAMVGLPRGEVQPALADARVAVQRARDSGHEKMMWRTSVVLAEVLAENLQADEAAAVLPPISSRIDLQDTIYDGAARIHGRLAVDDPAGALAAARTITPLTCHFVSPADVVSEVMTDPRELRAFVEALTARGEVLLSPRMAVVNGRLALAEGRIDEAIAYLSAADADFRKSELMLDAWHVGRGLAEAEFRAGRESAAEDRLQRVVQDASSAGAHLAARLASLTADRLGLDVDAVGGPAPAAPAGYVATGERMVSVLFADVRGYTELSGEAAPAEVAERISTLQRWARQEV